MPKQYEITNTPELLRELKFRLCPQCRRVFDKWWQERGYQIVLPKQDIPPEESGSQKVIMGDQREDWSHKKSDYGNYGCTSD